MNLPFFEVERLKGRVFPEERLQSFELLGRESVRSGFDDSEKPALAGNLGGDGSAEVVEVETQDSDDMESVCDNAGVWEPPADDLAVRTGEVDADHLHPLTAL